MSYEEKEEGFKLSRKNMIKIGLAGIVILGLMVLYFVSNKSSTFPIGKLTASPSDHVYERNKEMFPIFCQFDDIPYAIGVPSKGITKVEGGYAYTTNGMGIIVAEVSNARTMAAYSADMYSSLYAVQSQPTVNEVLSEKGYMNGFAASYGVYKVTISELDKNIYEFMYMLEAGKENIVVAATTESEKTEDYVAARDYLITMIQTVVEYEPEDSERISTDEDKDSPKDSGSSDSSLYDDGPITREVVLTAAQDYEKLCLIFSYINVKTTPQECYALDKSNKKYNAAFVSPGEYGFVIPNVSEGDDIVLYVTGSNLDGATLSQQEYSEYQKEQASYENGNLHVEEYDDDSDTSTEEESNADNSKEEFEDNIEGVLNEMGASDEILTKVTRFDE